MCTSTMQVSHVVIKEYLAFVMTCISTLFFFPLSYWAPQTCIFSCAIEALHDKMLDPFSHGSEHYFNMKNKK